MDLTVSPAELMPGDRLAVYPDPEDTWPQVDSVGGTVTDDWLGESIQVHVVGQAEPRVFPVNSGLAVRRADDTSAAAPEPPPPEPSPDPGDLAVAPASPEPPAETAPPQQPAP